MMNSSLCTRLAALVLVFLPPCAMTQTAPANFRVTLLGTGTPRPSSTQMGPSTLVEAGGQRLLFDVGRGATIRLTEAGVPLREVDAVFLTHFHSDHVNGLADLWLTGWLPAAYAQRATAFEIYGPTGTEDMMAHLRRAHDADIRIRMADEQLSEAGVSIAAHNVEEGVIYERDGVRVMAFDVDHGELIKPALGYRVEYGGRAVVLSGDTRPSTNLIEHARGADVVIHEVMAATDEQLRSDAARRIVEHHTTPEQAGRVFAQIDPGLAVYSHLITTVPDDVLIQRTRAEYSGPLEIGRDLMVIEVAESPRVVRRDGAARSQP